jgi:hypothetical protein
VGDVEEDKDFSRKFGEMISSTKLVEFDVSATVKYKQNEQLIVHDVCEKHGCGVTVPANESLTGNIQIVVDPNAASKANNLAGGTKTRGTDGKILRFENNRVIDGHEIGHAYDLMSGQEGNWRKFENLVRMGYKNPQRREDH